VIRSSTRLYLRNKLHCFNKQREKRSINGTFHMTRFNYNLSCHIQGGAEPTDTLLWHVTIFYIARKGWNEMRHFYVQSKQFITYLVFLTLTSWRPPPSFAPRYVTRFTNPSKTRRSRASLMAAVLSLYCVWAILKYAFFQTSPWEEIQDCEVRRPYRPWDTRYHDNAVCH